MRKVSIILFSLIILSQFVFAGRYYDAKTGRFLQIDPKATKYPNLSPYAYCADNPLKYIDPDGKELRPSGNLVAVHNRMYKESPTYKAMVDRVNERLGNIVVPMNETSLKEINGGDKSGTARGVTKPGLDSEGKYKVEGTKVMVGEKTELKEVGSTKTQEAIIAHEVEHVDQITADPAATQQSVNDHKGEDHDSTPIEQQAIKVENTVVKEITNSRDEERITKHEEKKQ
jgi:hypothetical protein